MLHINNQESRKINQLTEEIRILYKKGEYDQCIELLNHALECYPHAPQPYNLYGLILEEKGDHVLAMKHFRASWALEPTYLPARYNMNIYGSFGSSKKGAFDEKDCPVVDECNLNQW